MNPSEDELISADIGAEWLFSPDRRYANAEDQLFSVLKNDQSRSLIHKESIGEELDYEDEKVEDDMQLTMNFKHNSVSQDIPSDLKKIHDSNCKMLVDVGHVSDHNNQHSNSEKNLHNSDGHLLTDKEPVSYQQCIHSKSEKILWGSDGEVSLGVGQASDCQDIHCDSDKNLSNCESQLSKHVEPTFDNLDRQFDSEKNLCNCKSRLLRNIDPTFKHQDKSFDSEKNLCSFDGQLDTVDVQLGIGKKEYDEGEIEEGEAIDDDGSTDIEDGEIEDVSINENMSKYSCRFYQRGKCIWGKQCRFLHLSDKGLYNMFDSIVTAKRVLPLTSCFTNEAKFNCQPFFEPEERSESIWDQALNEAKERIKQSRVRKSECFDKDKLYMTVENSDKFIEKPKNVEHFHTRASSPAPISKKPNCDFSSRMELYKSDRQIYIKNAVKPKLAKKSYGIKFGYHSEWRDPWRRSKTPPKRRRITSRSSISSKSSASRDHSPSSSETASRGRSPIAKPPFRKSNSRSCSYRRLSHRKSPSRSSCSCSSPSSRSSPEFSLRRVRSGKRKHSSPSFSPVYRKKISHSPEVVLPFTRQSLSVSPLKSGRKVNLQNKSIERKPSKGSSVSRSRSPSFSSKSSVKEELLARRSCSDMSISPQSGSSLSGKSGSSDRDFDSCLHDPVPHKHRFSITKDSRLAQCHVDFSSYVSGKNKSNLEKQPCASVTKVLTKPVKKKKMCVLEMELLKYQGSCRPIPKHPLVEPTSTKAKSSQSVAKLCNDKELGLKGSIAKSNQVHLNKPSKRDLLIRQLQAVEEAIARKRKSYLT